MAEKVVVEGLVKTSVIQEIAHIEFHHPQSNSLPSLLLKKLSAAVEEAGNNQLVKAIFIKSSGEKAFCAGASFDELISISDFETGKKFFSGFGSVINAIRKAPKFVIIRVQGKAVGGGVGLAAAADYALATQHSLIRLSELAVGIGAFVVGPAVERKIGTAAFTQLSINPGQWQSATWAREKGLFAEVYPDIQTLDAEAEILLSKVKTYNPQAMAMLKKIFWQGTENWDQLLAERAEISGKLVLSDFTRNAIHAFKNKS